LLPPPPTSYFLKAAAGIEKGARKPGRVVAMAGRGGQSGSLHFVLPYSKGSQTREVLPWVRTVVHEHIFLLAMKELGYN